MFSIVFFFFKQKPAYEMRISDWSSDVCSSDLAGRQPLQAAAHAGRDQRRPGLVQGHPRGARTVLAPDQTEGISNVMLFLLTLLGLVLIRPQEYPALVDLDIQLLQTARLGPLVSGVGSTARRPPHPPPNMLFAASIASGREPVE